MISDLATEVATSLGIGLDQMNQGTQAISPPPNSLLVEVVSAKGLPQEPSETLQNIAVHVSYQGQIQCSPGVISNTDADIVFNYSTLLSFQQPEVTDVDPARSSIRTCNNPLLIYLTTMSVSGQGQQVYLVILFLAPSISSTLT